MAAATGTVVISQGGSNFDSATYPRFVLGDGTNSLTFVIDNTARGLLLEDESTAATSYSSTSDFPLEDPMKGNILIPTIDEADGAQKSILGLWLHDATSVNTLAAAIASESVLDGSDNLIAITSRLHFEVTDADGNTIRIGLGGSTQAKKSTVEGHMQGNAYRHQAQNGAGQTWYSAYQESSTSTNYLVHVTTTGGGDDYAEYRLPVALYGAFKAAYEDDNINIDAYELCKEASGDGLRQSSLGSNQYGSNDDTYTRGVLLQYKTAGFKGNACRIVLKDPNGVLDSNAKQRGISYGYEEYTSATMRAAYGNRDDNLGTNNNFPGESLNTEIYFRGGTVAGSGSDTALTTANIAEAIKEIINGSKLGITATRSSSTVSLTNDTDGDGGNVTITTTNAGALFTVAGMSNASSSEEEDVARRTTIAGDQIALSASAGLAASSNAKSQLKLDISGSLAALGAAPAENDVMVIHDVTAGVPKKITVSELIGSVAAGSDTQVQFNDGGSALGGDSGLTFNKTTDTLSVGNDLKLTSDSAILSLGAGDDATLTHDGTTGLTIAATPISIDSTGELHLNSTTGDIKFQDGGTDQLALDMDGTAGEIIMQLKVDSDDFVFKQYDGTEVFRVEDDGSFDIAGGAGSSGVTVSAAGQLTADGRIIVDDATEATSTTDGSLQTDGGLSVAKSAVIGDDLDLLSDGAIFAMGAGQDVTITHDGGTGATLASAGAFLIDGANAVSIDGASGVNIGTNDSGAAISIGHTTSEVTVNDNLTVTGDLTVNGTTTTVDTTNLTVEDPIVLLNKNNSSANGQGGIAIENGGSSSDMVLGRVANDTWGVGTKDTSAGSVTTLADMTLGAFRAGKLEIDGANDYIDVDTDLKIIAAADVLIDPAGGELKVDGNVIPNSDSADSLGASGTAWANLYVDAIDLNGQGSISMGGTGRIDLDADDDTSIRASADDVITFEAGGVDALAVKATGLHIVDDLAVYFGSGDDARIEYDEDGTDQLRIHQPAAGVVIAGTNPKLVLGDAGAEDTMLVFDGNAQDFRMGLDDGTDKLEIGVGSAHGTTTALTIDASQQVAIVATTAASSTSTGALTVAGGASVAADLYVGDDLELDSDGAKLGFGADSDVSLTHVADTGLLLNSSRQLQFGDSATHIKQVADGQLELEADTSIQVDAPIVDFEDDGVILQFGADDDVTLTHSHNEGLLLNSTNRLMFGDVASYIHQSADGVLDLVSDTEIELNATTIDINGTVDLSAGLTVGGAATLSSVAALTMAANDSTHHILVTDSDDNIVKKESYQDLISGSAGLGLRVNATSKKLEVAAIEDHFMSGNVGGTGGKVFTLSATPVSGSVMVFINGIFQVQAGSHATIGAGDYSISGQTITLVDANIVDAEDEVVVKYILA